MLIKYWKGYLEMKMSKHWSTFYSLAMVGPEMYWQIFGKPEWKWIRNRKIIK